MSEILDRDIFEAYVYHAKHAEQLIRHDAALRAALAAAEAREKELRYALEKIEHTGTGFGIRELREIARRALAGQEEKP